MEFITKLSEEELLDLISSCNKRYNEMWLQNSDKIATIERIDVHPAEEFVFVEAYQGTIPVGHYSLTDFSVLSSSLSPGQRDSHLLTDRVYEGYFIEYLATKFGMDYVNALYSYRTKCASAEASKLWYLANNIRK